MSTMDRKRVQVLSAFVLLSVYWTSAEGVITCTVPSVSAGGSTNVTCAFPQDIRISKNNMKVQRLPLRPEDIDLEKAVNVLECHWLDQQTFNCDAQPGYKLIGQVSNRAVVGIPTATQHHEGKYTCEVVPSEPSDIHPCYFHLKGELNASVVDEKLSQLSGESIELRHMVAKEAQELKSIVSAVLALVVLCIVAAVVVVLIVFRQRLRKLLPRRNYSTTPRSADGNDEEKAPLNAENKTEAMVKYKSETTDPPNQMQADHKLQVNADETVTIKDKESTSEKTQVPLGSPKGETSGTVNPQMHAAVSTGGSLPKRVEPPVNASRKFQKQVPPVQSEIEMGVAADEAHYGDEKEAGGEAAPQENNEESPHNESDEQPGKSSNAKEAPKKKCIVS